MPGIQKKEATRHRRRHGAQAVLAGMAMLWSAWLLPSADAADGGERDKLVFAHHMGSLNAGRGAMAWHTRHPELGHPSVSNGGDYRNLPLVPYDMWNLTLEESAHLQIRRAMRIGLDGFAVNAWAGGDQAKDFLDALFKVAEEHDYPFYISICPDPSAIDQPEGLTQAVADAIRYLLDRHGDSPKLARRDGKPIIFGYQSNFVWVEYLENKFDGDRTLVDIARTTEEGWALVSDAYRNLEKMVGRELYIQFDMGAFYHGLQVRGVPEDGYRRAAAVIAQHMPAVCQFLPSQATPDFASETLAAGAEWGQPIYLNYDNPRTNWTFGGPGTRELRRLWGEARNGATLLQLTTWNDYHENTNISPGITTNYAYFDLTGYFIEWWKTGRQPQPQRDKLYVFSRKYPWGAPTYPFQSIGNSDGVIEILTLLPEPAWIEVPGRGAYEAPAGLYTRHFPVTPGPVSAELSRDGIVSLVVESPEPVTERPFRQDNGLTGISSECEAHWRADFGDLPREIYSEYGDFDGDGLPNWFEMYWFGHFGDKSTATSANPDEDVNKDGYTNLEAFLAQRSPIGLPPVRMPFGGVPAPIPGRIQAEAFDEGGQELAYRDHTTVNQGGEFRREEQVDIEPTADAEGQYNVGWMEAGEWLEYTVEIEHAGVYEVDLRVASQSGGGVIGLFLDGVKIADPASVPATGGWQSWATLRIPWVYLEAGERILRVTVEQGGFNLNFMEFSSIAPGRAPFSGAPIAVPGRIQAQDFDLGGNGVAYYDTTAFNEGNSFRLQESVDLEVTADAEGDYNLGWTAPDEWLFYTVEVKESGIYNVAARVASAVSGSRFMLEFDNAGPIRIAVPDTGGWQEWETVVIPGVSLQSGVQSLRLYSLTGDFNVNFIDVQPAVTSFEEWLKIHFTADELEVPSLHGPFADASENGIPNLLEYALHRDPRAGGREGLPRGGKMSIDGQPYLTFTYTRPATAHDLEYRVEVSENLIDWQSGSEHLVPVSVTPQGTAERVIVRDAIPLETLPRRFIRLRVLRQGEEMSND